MTNELTTENGKWYTSKEMCEMNSVSEITLKRFNEEINGITDDTNGLIRKGGYNNRAYFYSEEALKQFQLWLMRNQVNQGKASHTVKQATTQSVELGALTIAANASVEATQELCKLLMEKAYETQRAKQLEAQNTQLKLDVKEAKEETAYITHVASAYQHNFPWKPSILGKQFGLSGKAVNDIFVENGFIYKDPRNGVWIVTESGRPYAWYGWNDKSVEYPQLWYSDLAFEYLKNF